MFKAHDSKLPTYMKRRFQKAREMTNTKVKRPELTSLLHYLLSILGFALATQKIDLEVRVI